MSRKFAKKEVVSQCNVALNVELQHHQEIKYYLLPGIVALITTLAVTGLVSWVHLINIDLDSVGLAILGTILGTIGALGGLVIGLLSLFTLAELDRRLRQQAETLYDNWKQEHAQSEKAQLQRLVRALSKFSMIGFAGVEYAEQLTKETLDIFPELPYIREIFGLRLGELTLKWKWIDICGNYEIIRTEEPYDHRVGAIKWLEEAVGKDRSGDVKLEYPSRVYLALAELYAISERVIDFSSMLDRAITTKIEPSLRDIALLCCSARSLDDVRGICNKLNWQWVEQGDNLKPSEHGWSSWVGVESTRFNPIKYTIGHNLSNEKPYMIEWGVQGRSIVEEYRDWNEIIARINARLAMTLGKFDPNQSYSLQLPASQATLIEEKVKQGSYSEPMELGYDRSG